MTTSTLARHVRHRGGALAHVTRPDVWRGAFAVDMSRAALAVPLRVGVAVGLVLVVGGLLGHRDVAGFAALGALVSAFCRPDPYRVRWSRLIVLGVGIIGAIAIGGALGVTSAPVAAEIIIVPLLGGAAALLVGMLHIAGPGAVIFVFAAAGAAGSVHSGDALVRALVATGIGAACGLVASLAPWLLHGIGRLLGRPAQPSTGHEVRYEGLWTTLTRRPPHDLLVNCARIVVASAASAAIAAAVGLSHPMWAAMGAMTAMAGATYHVTVQRGIQRLLGNVIGAAIAAALLSIGLGYWGAVVAIVVFQTIAELMATVNYGITSAVVTPMALLLTALSANLSPTAALDRVADTLIGVVIGIVVAAFTITRRELAHSAA